MIATLRPVVVHGIEDDRGILVEGAEKAGKPSAGAVSWPCRPLMDAIRAVTA